VRSVLVLGTRIYAGTFGGGLSVSPDGRATFTTHTTANGLGSDLVRSVYAEGSTVYVGTIGGSPITATAADGTGIHSGDGGDGSDAGAAGCAVFGAARGGDG